MPVGRLRRAAVVLAIGLVVLLAASLGLVVYGEWRLARATERFEATLGSSDLERFMRPELPAAENAATWLQAGAAAIVVSEDRGFDDLRARGAAPWGEEATGLARRLVEDNGPALELLWRAVGCAGSSYELDYRLGPQTNLPPLVDLLMASRLLAIDGRLALVDGDMGRLRLDLATLDRLADSLAEESLLITALLAMGVDREYLHLVHRLVTGGGGEALLAEIEAALAGRERQAAFLRSLAGDGSMVPRSSAWMLQEPGGGPLGWARRQLARPAEKLLLADLLDEYSAIGELAAMPWPEVVAASEARIAAGFPRFFAVSLYPNLVDGVGKLKAGQSVTQLALEAIRYRRALARDGAYPTARPALVDPYTGGEVRVEHRPDGGVSLEVPGGLDLWHVSHPKQSRPGLHRFSWTLPAAP